MSGNYSKRVDELRCTLERLSASPITQIAYLSSLGVVPCADELALELNDLVAIVPEFVEQGILTGEQAERIRAVDRHLAAMTAKGDCDLWTEDALRSLPEWEVVRALARAALQDL